MGRDERRMWFHAAYLALDGIPADLCERGAKEAMRTADHPSKIVAAVTKAIGKTWDDRIALAARIRQTEAAKHAQVETLRLTAPVDDEDYPESVEDMLKRVWPNMEAHERGETPGGKLNLNPDRECRKPSRADYLAFGVTPDVLDGLGIE